MTNVTARLTVALADTEPITVEGLRSLLKLSGLYEVIQPSKTLESLAQILVRMSPRAAFVDKALGGPEVLNWLHQHAASSNTAVIVWGQSFSDPEALRFLQAGARGILR